MPAQKARHKHCMPSYDDRDFLAFQQMNLKGKRTILNWRFLSIREIVFMTDIAIDCCIL
jgi:hypothetical protein